MAATLVFGLIAACSKEEGSSINADDVRRSDDNSGDDSSGDNDTGSNDGTGSSGGGDNRTSGNSDDSGNNTGSNNTSPSGTNGPAGGGTAVCSGLELERGDAAAACLDLTMEAERVDVDMYIMMDRSSSMAKELPGGSVSRWEGVKEAIEAFVTSDEAVGLGVGIQFFGQSDIGDESLDCDVSLYAEPDVPIGLLPETGDAIVDSIDAHSPGGFTPTLPALQGALTLAKSHARDNPERATVVVLVTDGFPTRCQESPSIPDIADVAEEAVASDPPVPTYVVGLAGGLNLDQIARAGRTGSAYLVEEGDVAEPLLAALNNISNDALACQFSIPEAPDDSQRVDPDKVQIVYTPANGDPEEIPRVAGYASCPSAVNGGWYFDSLPEPTRILTCPCSCQRMSAGRIDVRLGCEPRPGPLR